jgi:ribosome-binding protein aMBF1 (putative translation factor)
MSDNNDNWTTVSNKKQPKEKKDPSQGSPKNAVSGFEHQNWEKTIIHGKSNNSTGPKQIVHKNINPEAIRLAKLENDETIKLKSLSLDARQELVKGRVAKGLNQEKLANALSMPANLYKDIENGKTIPQQNILSKINFFLGTKAKLT